MEARYTYFFNEICYPYLKIGVSSLALKRVHFLTEDKVKLGDDIRQYVEKIAHDFEQKEKLSIESDIWRSKFLASRFVILF